MLEETVKDYAAYLKLDISSGLKSVQDVIDNMLTRLEELTSVLQMIKLKNCDCVTNVSEDISRYRAEVTILAKKINTLNEVILKITSNVDILEKQVEKAEIDFGANYDNRIKNFLKPFLKRATTSSEECVSHTELFNLQLRSVMDNFDNSNSS